MGLGPPLLASQIQGPEMSPMKISLIVIYLTRLCDMEKWFHMLCSKGKYFLSQQHYHIYNLVIISTKKILA